MRALRVAAGFSRSPYRVLGVSITATPGQLDLAVQTALRRAGFAFGQPPQSPAQQALVQEIFEAYATLSIERNRGAAAAFVPKKGDSDSFVTAADAVGGETAALMRDQREERALMMKRYNVNALGRYRGGAPRRHSYARGSALAPPGEYHSLAEQNELEGANASCDFHVTRQDVVELYRYKLDDEEARLIKPTYFFAEPEEFSTRKLRNFLKIVAGVAGFFALGKAVELYTARIPSSGLVEDEHGVLRVAQAAPAGGH